MTSPLIGAALLTLAFSLQYILFAGLLYCVFWVAAADRLRHRRTQSRPITTRQYWLELLLSLQTMAVFAALTVPVLLRGSHSKLIRHNDSWPVFALSLAILILVNDAYFYWAHRLMHWGPIYRATHRVHHRFTNPSPWAAFSFHPLEAVISYLWFPILAFLVPIDMRAAGLYVPLMIFYTVFIHLGYDVLLSERAGRGFWSWLALPTSHNDHHRDVRGNYGFYFSFWDRLMGTVRVERAPAEANPGATQLRR